MTAALRPHDTFLTVLEGGKNRWQAEEARAELIAFFHEMEADAEAIQTIEAQAHIPSLRVIQLAGRMGQRAAAARAEYLALTAPEGGAA